MTSSQHIISSDSRQHPWIVKWHDPGVRRANANLVGWSGAGWIHMAGKGLPVPQGFTITTAAFRSFVENDHKVPECLLQEVKEAITGIEQATGRSFNSRNGPPLLFTVSTRSSVRMSGLMDDICGYGLNEHSVRQLAKLTGDARFAWLEYLNFIEQFGDLVLGVTLREDEGHNPFTMELAAFTAGIYGRDVSPALLLPGEIKELSKRYNELIRQRTDSGITEDSTEQLRRIIHTAFSSWDSPHAIDCRRKKGIPDDSGVAIDFRRMTYGNTGKHSGSGCLITRDPVRGTRKCRIEYKTNTHADQFASDCRLRSSADGSKLLALQLENLSRSVEACFRDVCEVGFTVEGGIIHIDSVYPATLTAKASLKIVTDMVREGMMSWKAAVLRFPADKAKHLLGMVVKDPDTEILAKGVPASQGVVSGSIYLNGARALKAVARGENVLLVREQFRARDQRASGKACGLVSVKGGLSSIAASMARHEGIPCVCGISDMVLDEKNRTVTIAGIVFKEGSILTIDGGSGLIHAGDRLMPSDIKEGLAKRDKRAKASKTYRDFLQLLSWCFRISKSDGCGQTSSRTGDKAINPEDVLMPRLSNAQNPLSQLEHFRQKC